MTHDQILNRLNKIVEFAKVNYIRLLIEVDPDYKKLYIYTDQEYNNHISILIKKYGLADYRRTGIEEIKWVLTNEKMYYPGNRPKLTVLAQNKGDVSMTFYRSNVDVKTINEGGVRLYFVAIHGEFTKEVISNFRQLITIMSENELNGAGDTLEEYSYSKKYKFNRLAKNRFALYKY